MLAQLQQSFCSTQVTLQELQKDVTKREQALMKSEMILEVTRAQLNEERRICTSLQEQESDLNAMTDELTTESDSLQETIHHLEEELNLSDHQTYGTNQNDMGDRKFVVVR